MASARRIVLLGAPGAGKGTQAQLLAAKLGLVHISTGDILREEVRRGTELGNQAKEYMDRGDLVPDELIVAMIAERIRDRDGFILDGFPRTTAQAEALEKLAPVERVINLQLPEEEVVRRLSARRVCEDCGKIYNLITSPPQREGVCDECGGRLIQRDDDKPEVIRRRFRVYTEETAPLKDFYRQRGLLREVDATGTVEEVFNRIEAALA